MKTKPVLAFQNLIYLFLLFAFVLSSKTEAAPAKRLKIHLVRSKVAARPSLSVYKQFQRRKQRPRILINRSVQRYHLYLITIGSGDWLFTYFGHNAIRIYDRQRGTNRNYNFGTFNIDSSFSGGVNMLWSYLQFRLKYWLSTGNYYWSIRRYRWQDRTYRMREILLSKPERERMVAFLRTHARPKNRSYVYHHYTKNCSTKVMDAFSAAIGPSFLDKSRVKRGTTYRKLVHEKMILNPFVMILMDFGMGPPADRLISWKEEMFLPEKLEEYVSAPFWKKRRSKPLVGPVQIIHKRQKAKTVWPLSASNFIYLLGLFLSLLGLALWKTRFFRTWIRIILFFMGLLGVILAFMMWGTNFPEPPGNILILFFHPFHWLIWWWLARKRWDKASAKRQRFIIYYLAAHVVLGLLYLIARMLLPLPYQSNIHYIIFTMSIFGIAASHLRRDERIV